MVYGVTVQTFGRRHGDGITMLFIEANDALTAESRVRQIAQRRFECVVLVDHPVLCPGFAPTPCTWESDPASTPG
jgi:hypothetical protein